MSRPLSEEKFDRFLARFDDFLNRFDERENRLRQESELSREVLLSVLAENRRSHREVMARLEDLGVHMREQTEALMRINGKLGPNGA